MCRDDGMRMTLELDDDLVTFARNLPRQRGMSVGPIISELARQSLATGEPLNVRNGALLFVAKVHASKSDLRIVTNCATRLEYRSSGT